MRKLFNIMCSYILIIVVSCSLFGCGSDNVNIIESADPELYSASYDSSDDVLLEDESGDELINKTENEITELEKIDSSNTSENKKSDSLNEAKSAVRNNISKSEFNLNSDNQNNSSLEETDQQESYANEEIGKSLKPAKIDIEKYIGKSVSALISDIGAPVSASYSSSCLGEGEDGELHYDGFIVYTYKEFDKEEVVDIE